MRYKLAVLLGCPPSLGHNPENAADEGLAGDLLIESDSLAWNLNPDRFPALTVVRPVEVMIDGPLFSLWEPPGVDFGETVSDAQRVELPLLGRDLATRLGYEAAAVGVVDLDHQTIRRLYFLRHRDLSAAARFFACGLDATRSRLVLPLSGGSTLLEPASSAALKKACEQDMECSTVLGPLSEVFARLETSDVSACQAWLTQQAAELDSTIGFSPDGTVEINGVARH